eukprot:9615073-Alexandrium_andersonii.AAC.1
MSASLVGSEMCIRDRPSAAHHGATPDAEEGGAGASCSFPVSAWRHPGPVSYTHLTLPTICSV